MTTEGAAPDLIQPVLGYKALAVAKNGSLHSPTYSHRWTLGKNASVCKSYHKASSGILSLPSWVDYPEGFKRSHDDTPIGDGTWCCCGFHVTKEVNNRGLLDSMYPGGFSRHTIVNYAVVQVALTGKVVEHNAGYRGEAATIKHIWLEKGTTTKPVVQKVIEHWGGQAEIGAYVKSTRYVRGGLPLFYPLEGVNLLLLPGKYERTTSPFVPIQKVVYVDESG